jgi:hypothetical protein
MVFLSLLLELESPSELPPPQAAMLAIAAAEAQIAIAFFQFFMKTPPRVFLLMGFLAISVFSIVRTIQGLNP